MFDPQQQREILGGNLGHKRIIATDLDEIRRKGALLPFARSAVSYGLRCLFVELDAPAHDLLVLANNLVTEAISTGEALRKRDADEELMVSYHALAMARWVLNGQDDEECLAKQIEHSKHFWAKQGHGRDSETLDIELPHYLNAGDPAYAVEVAESSKKVKEPQSLGAIRSSRVMAYVLARRQMETGRVDEAHLDAAKRFLDRTMDETYLGRGLAVEAAVWLKIVYWNLPDRSLSPQDVLRKAYDHMPHITAPP